MKNKEKQVWQDVANVMCECEDKENFTQKYRTKCRGCNMLDPIKHIVFFLNNSDYRKIPENSVVVEKGLLEYWKDKATNQNGLLLNINGANGWFPKEFIVNAIETYKSMKDKVVISREEYEKLKNENKTLLNSAKMMVGCFCEQQTLKEQTSKETAEKILKDLKLLVPDNALEIVIRYFKEIIGVEIKG